MLKSQILDPTVQNMSIYTTHRMGHFATDISSYVSKCAILTGMEIFKGQYIVINGKSTTVSSTFLNSNYFYNYNLDK